MDYSMDAIANKMVMVIVGLSVIMALVGLVIYIALSGNPEASRMAGMLMGVNIETVTPADAIPFAAGIGAVACLNIVKVFLMKRAVNNAVKRDAVSAKLYLQGQYFLRLVLTAVVLFSTGWLHTMVFEAEHLRAGNPQYVNFMGAFLAIFTFPIAMYSMRFFLKEALEDNALPESDTANKSVTQSAIDQLNAIGAESEQTEK
jgi:hypothetical protein